MEKQYKTTIQCAGCVKRLTPLLEEIPGLEHWEVDLQSPERTLTVKGEVDAQLLIETIEDAGFEIDPVEGQTFFGG